MTASQNTMAAAIHGSTNHSWGEVPIDLDNPDARQTRKNKAGISTLFLKCLNQRWLCIDEISTSSLLVLGIMESNLRKACKRHLHALDKDGSPRSWGGLNLVTGGDWNQLPAVKAKSIFRNPFSRDLVGPEKRISHLFWGLDDEFLPDNRDYLFELTEQNRSKDIWLNAMLAQDRVGQENYAVWCFCHGLPTTKVGSWLPGQDMPACGDKACKDLQEKVWPKLFMQRVPWSRRQMQECEHCKKERERRCIVLGCGSKGNISEAIEQFAGAAYVHPYNQSIMRRYFEQCPSQGARMRKSTGALPKTGL